MYLSRLTLKRSPSAEALGALINPENDEKRIDAHHRLIWTAFAGDPNAKRDFLWREDSRGCFIVMSKERPHPADLFEAPEIKPFEPDLRTGDRLAFRLRVNPTRTVKVGDPKTNGKRARKHQDIVMQALHGVPKGKRATARMVLAQTATEDWLRAQGERYGYQVVTCEVSGYRVLDLSGRRQSKPRFGIVDVDGVIEVKQPEPFLERLKQGFGRAKAFGCGLMLIRRA